MRGSFSRNDLDRPARFVSGLVFVGNQDLSRAKGGSGVENILRGVSDPDVAHDYVEDEGWPAKFISYGRQPSLSGHVDIHRLTSQEDFKSRDAGLNPLEFEFET